MDRRVSCFSANARRILALLCLAVAVGACAGDDCAMAPGLKVVVCIDVTPDSTIFTWDLAGPGGYQQAGAGDTVLVGLPEGEYQLTWAPVEDFDTPDPASVSMFAVGGDTITFTGIYHLLPTERLEILFLGSSYFASNMLIGSFRSLAMARGKELLVDFRIPSGKFLDFHASDPTSISLINSRDWDYVILQGVGSIVAYPEDAHFDLKATLQSLESTIRGNCSTTRIMFCMPWAFEDGMTWTPGGTDTYFDMQQRIYDNTLTYPEIVDIVISPVGWAWHAVMLEEPPLHYLYMSDWNHPSPRGSYLTACAIFVSVYLESVEGTPYLGNLSESEAFHFQQIATSTVLDNLELWHLDGK